VQYGQGPEAPEVSVVVPLYGRIDLVEHQLAQFGSDPEFQRVDLIYVLDSPDLAENLRASAGDLLDIYGVPFRVAFLPRNVGFATANNVGASLGQASLLLLCNSDVFPREPGWLSRMAEFYRSTPSIGALGPRLLFEDESIQHAGMYFRKLDEPGLWENMHYHKGLHRSTPAANVTRRVPAVTAACLMIDHELFRSVGGLRSIYIQGDYEDSDLCLRLHDAGYENWYFADAELYHLEGQSYPSPLRASAGRYNCWLHSHLWGDRIDALMNAPLHVQPRLRVPPPHPDDGAAVEIQRVELRMSDADAMAAAELELPVPGARNDLHCLGVKGWIQGRSCRAFAVEAVARGQAFRRFGARPLSGPPAGDGGSPRQLDGFEASLSTVGLPLAFDVTLRAHLQDGTWTDFAVIRGRRRTVTSLETPHRSPVLITTCGRTGSSLLVRLLAEHPAVVTWRPSEYEPRVASYWALVLGTLSEPSSYLQSLAMRRTDARWWLGNGPSPLVDVPDSSIRDLLGMGNVEALGNFCRGRVDAFYERVATLQERSQSRWFVEKCSSDYWTRAFLFELYPDAREIVLVRDFRDVICSMFAFEQRGHRGAFGRNLVASDEEFVARIGAAAGELLAAYRERAGESLLLRYEDLIRSPDEALREVLGYLGLETDPETIRRMLDLAGEAPRPDLREHMTSSSVAASIGRWRQDLDARMQEACRAAFERILPEFGYS
jgi:GT2 family glycosyltransferase